MRGRYRLSLLWKFLLLIPLVGDWCSSCESFIGPHSSPHSLGRRTALLELSTHNDDRDEASEETETKEDSSLLDQSSLSESSTPQMQLPPRWKLALAYVGFIAFWPLLAFVQVYLRTHEFDVETYLTVKGLLDTVPADETSSGIMELPPLSPAERIVDALFGPNQVDRRGF